MGMLESKFTRVDLDTLIEAMGDWETVGNHDYHMLSMIKNMPMPPEDHEAFEYIKDIKAHFLKREREINDSRTMRQERATLLKAKLMLVRADMSIDRLFEMSVDANSTQTAPTRKEASNTVEETPKVAAGEIEDVRKRLALAEFFIKDLGTWAHYEKFLAEKAE